MPEKRLERLRDRAQAQMAKILQFSENISENTSLEAIKTRLDTLEERYQSFNERELELYDNPDYKSIADVVDEIYYKAKELLTQACGSRDKSTRNTDRDLNTTLGHFMDQQRTFYEGVNTANHVRLPKINIEPFSGDYKYWASFHDLFKSTVHNNQGISGCHKLQMLNGVLKGEAAALIRHFPITDNNYEEAWEKICNRYNKMTPIVTSLVQTFLDQKPCVHSSGKDLRRISETSDEVIRGLRALGPNAETRDPWLIHILLGKIDEVSKQLWATESVGRDFPTLDNLLQFLNKRCDALEICDTTNKKVSTRSTARSFLTSQPSATFDCIVCHQQHPIFRCPEFKNMNLDARLKLISERNLCNNCLRKGHISTKCFSRSTCLICNKRHHTLLHQGNNGNHLSSQSSTSHHVSMNHPNDNQLDPSNQLIKSTSESTQDTSQKTQVLHTHYSSLTTVLPTAMVYIKSRTGKLQLYRALLDSGSQSSFVTEPCAQSLGLKRSHSSVSVYGLASTPAGRTKGKINMTVYSRMDHKYSLNVTAHIINNISNLVPSTPIKLNKLEVQLELADPNFMNPSAIDVLLGADVFFEVLNPEQHAIDGFPIMQSSKFGWIVAGSLTNYSSSNLFNLHATTEPFIQVSNESLNQELKKFWEMEEISSSTNPALNTHECDIIYDQTTTRATNGQFIVQLPFKTPKPILGSSYEAARQRLLAMERKFVRDPIFFDSYKAFMHEYIALNHMTCIESDDIIKQDDKKYYLPHHAVFKSDSSTTKLRVVLDASCKTCTGLSLNDILQIGPNIQTDLSKILLKFRQHSIAMVADIEKMYRQILVIPNDTNYQMILWRDTPTETIKTYKLNTVTYGTACAPYLAIKTLKQVAKLSEKCYPVAAQVIHQDFYVDDLLTGCDNIAEAVDLKTNLNEILRKSGFNLRKWKSNADEFLNSFSQQDIETVPKLIEDDSSIKTLGIIWNSKQDFFSFKVHKSTVKLNWTKRKILSTVAKIYDPLGWLAPITILFKMLMQKLWLLKLEWDSDLPSNITNIWHELYSALLELEAIQIPRRLSAVTNATHFQLHAFCDASEAAYGAVIYLRSMNEFGEINVNIISAKSKVAPIKQVSLPRLELCGAVMLCKLVQFCVESLSYKNMDIVAWTDSMIVLHWLSDVPRRWKSFIGNRTALILETIPRNKWQHIKSKENPADAITRGVKPQALLESQLWWRGPHWLKEAECYWPKSTSSATDINAATVEERSKYINVLTEVTMEHDVVSSLLEKFSSWFKIRKIMVYVLRFGRRTRNSELTRTLQGQITPAELNDAETVILRKVQQTAFKHEISSLMLNSPLSMKNQLSALDPFLDSDGLLRVGGRLRKSSLSYSTKYPVILPKNHRVCEIIIHNIHTSHMHAGNSLTLSIVRQRYWMMGARYTIKRCLKSCTVCIRYRLYKNGQKMADLPEARCTQNRPFLKTGLDYAGPLYIKRNNRKNSPSEKAYVAVFVCLAVKAVHLEVVSSLDTESFIAALRRFISRRGNPKEIWCDNGSNFIGANRELKKLKCQIIQQSNNPLIFEFLLQKGISFQFNPPHAPHFGGLWESVVKSFKYHLKRVTNINLSFEELTTLVTQIESLLNSRPLCRMNDDPSDLQILTPAHFLVGESLTIIPEPWLDAVPQNKLSRWQNIQHRIQGFWTRWHQDYLTSLQQRFKWKHKTEQLEVDDVVLIREDNLYPSQWLLGRVTEVHPGSDGITRVVTLKTPKNEVKRPVNKLVKLLIKQ